MPIDDEGHSTNGEIDERRRTLLKSPLLGLLPLSALGSTSVRAQPDGSVPRGYNDVVQTADGGHLLVGVSGVEDEQGGFEDFRGWAVKRDSNGDELWNKTYISALHENEEGGEFDDDLVHNGFEVAIPNGAGGHLLVGWTWALGSDVKWPWLVNIDADGNIQWNREYRGLGRFSDTTISSSFEDGLRTPDGGYLLAGVTNREVSQAEHSGDGWIVKIDANGEPDPNVNETFNPVNEQHIEDDSQHDEFYAVTATDDGGYLLVGEATPTGESDETPSSGWVLKLTDTFDLDWQETYQLSAAVDNEFNDVVQTSDGGYIVAGVAGTDGFALEERITVGDGWVMKIDGTGDVEWENNPVGDGFYGITPTDDGYLLLGARDETAWATPIDEEGTISSTRHHSDVSDSLFTAAAPMDGDHLAVGWGQSVDTGLLDGLVVELDNKLKLTNVRLVQTVENTRVVEPDHTGILAIEPIKNTIYTEPNPDLVVGRNGAIIFDLNTSGVVEDLSLSDEVKVKIQEKRVDGETPHSFTIPKQRVQNLINDTDDSYVVFNEVDAPVFEIKKTLEKVKVNINGGSSETTDEYPLTEGQDFQVRSERHLRLGFISVRDGEGGTNYGFIPEESDENEDVRVAGGPLNFETAVEDAVEYLRRVYPVSKLTVYRHETPIEGTTQLGDVQEDYQSALCTLRDTLSDSEFPTEEGVMVEGEAADLEEGFSTVVLITPQDHNNANQDYYSYHGLGALNGEVLGGFDAAASVLEPVPGEQGLEPVRTIGSESGTASIRDQFVGTVAQEIGHQFTITNDPYMGIETNTDALANTHPLAQRSDDNSDTTVNGLSVDFDHARHINSALTGVDDSPGVVSTGFDFTQDRFKLVDNFGFDLNQEDRFIINPNNGGFEPMSSFMSYHSWMDRWADARITQKLIESDFTNPSLGDDRLPVLCIQGEVLEFGELAFNSVISTVGFPTLGLPGNILLEVLDARNNVITALNVPDFLRFILQDGHRVVEGAMLATIPFPEETALVRATREGVVSRLNPIEKTIRNALVRVPDEGFVRRPAQLRKALNNKLDEIEEKMDAKEFHEAKQKLENDFRRSIDRWLKDDYEAAANQPTKQEMLDLVDDMTSRLETLAQESS